MDAVGRRLGAAALGAVTLEGTEKVAVVDCELTNIDGNGISINGYHRGS